MAGEDPPRPRAVDLSISELAGKVRGVVNPQAELVFNRSKPDGTSRAVAGPAVPVG